VPEINATYKITANISVSTSYMRIYVGGALITGFGLWSSSGVYTETVEAGALTNISIQAGGTSNLNSLIVERLDTGNIKANNIEVTGGQMQVPTGTVARPSLAFSKFPDTGFYLMDSTTSANGLGFAVGGARALQVITWGFIIESRIGFAGSTDTDIYAGTSAGKLQIRRGTSTTPVMLELHNRYASSSVREYANIGFANNQFIINVTNGTAESNPSLPIVLNSGLTIGKDKNIVAHNNLTISGLNGTGIRYVCADATGKLYGSYTGCI
jgi:hypothetical protein